jgi:VanZ family protein
VSIRWTRSGRHAGAPSTDARAWVLIAGYVAALGMLTVPRFLEQRLLHLAQQTVAMLSGPDAPVTTRWVEPSLNVALFVPLGLLLCWGLPLLSRSAVWGICVFGSVLVELVQYLFLPGRDGSARDVVTNSTGAALGVLLHWAITRSRRRPSDQSVRQQ